MVPASIPLDTVLGATLAAVPRSARWVLPVAAAAFRGTESSTVEPRVRALMLLRQATHERAPFWREALESTAASLGVDQAVVTAVESDEWDSAAGMSDRERAAVRWGDRVSRRLARRDAEAYRELTAVFDAEEVVELTLVASLAACFLRFANALRLPEQAPAELTPAAGPVPDADFRWWAAHLFDPAP